MKTENVPLTRQQMNLLACTDKMAAARGGVGSGKTVSLAYWLWMRAEQYPQAAHYVIGADYEQLRRGFFQSLIGILGRHGIEQGKDYSYRESPTPLIIFWHNGAKIQALSAELADRIRSTEFQSLVLEEPQTWHNGEEVYHVVIGRLRHNPGTSSIYGTTLQPQMRMSFNPTREAAVGTWLHTLIERQWTATGYKCWRFSVRDNVLMNGREEYVRLLEDNLPPDRWPSEIDGHWCTSGGQVYRTFDRVLNCRHADGLPPISMNQGQPILWALDFNVGWMASVIAQMHVQPMVQAGMGPIDIRTGISRPIYKPVIDGWQQRIVYVLDEIFLPDSGSPDVVAEFLRRYGEQARQQGVVLYGDTSGGARSQTASSASAARSNWAIIVQGLHEAGIRVEMRVPNANPSVGDRINFINAQFRSGAGLGMLVNEDRCPELLADFATVSFVTGKNDIDKSDTSSMGLKRTHLSDSLGYLVTVERAIADNSINKKDLRDIAQYMGR